MTDRYRERQQCLAKQVRTEGSDAVLISSAGSVRWLCGFSGSNSSVLVTGSRVTFFTDGRYRGEAEALLTAGAVTAVAIVSNSLPEAACAAPAFTEALSEVSSAGSPVFTLAIEADHVTLEKHAAILDAVAEQTLECAVIPLSGLANTLRAIKDGVERECMTRALRLTESVFTDVLNRIQEGITEREVAAEIDFLQKRAGASRSSFETIVAFGSNTARPHARPGPRRLAPAMPILLDFGCEIDGYCSDMTRMAFLGKPPPAFRNISSIVDSARAAALNAASAGMSTNDLDRTARRVIEDHGYGDNFVHSLGHGLGIDVHEWPGVSHRTSHTLQENMVVTIEPGIYLEGQFGVRLEDTIVVKKGHCERLNSLSTETVVI